jgi:hypothetical protein
MRYTINTKDEQGLIGIQLDKWQKEGKLDIVEKSETLSEIQARLDKVAAALAILKKAGYNSEVMRIYIKAKTGISSRNIDAILHSQEAFLRQIGALK